jgi:hypothetical protein
VTDIVKIPPAGWFPEMPDFVVLFDPVPAEIEHAARAAPQSFVFSFLTCPVEKTPDFSTLSENPRIARPFYIGNLFKRDQFRVAMEIVTKTFGEML